MLQITWRGVQESKPLTTLIRTKFLKLYRFYRQMDGCRVTIEQPNHSQQTGEHYHVRLEVSVPGQELVVDRAPAANAAVEDAYVAVRDAFRTMRRQLEDYVHVRRGYVKTHAPVSAPPA